MVYDFAGWATKNNLRCSDGRVIRKNAFADQNGKTVPLVWNHDHKDAQNVLGHALLENRDEGVYAYGTFNDTEAGQNAKKLVEHGDISSLSIYANQLKQNRDDVMHGKICEVSLVLAGANPGACIVEKKLSHSDISDEDELEEAIIFNDAEEIYISHADKDEDKDKKDETKSEDKKSDEETKSVEVTKETKTEVKETKPEEEKEKMADEKETKKPDSEKTVKDVFDTLNEEQKTVVYALIGQALADAEEAKKGSKNEEDEEMKHNVFDSEAQNDTLMHDGLNVILKDAKRFGTLRESYLEHAAEYGIENIDFINTDEKNIYDRPMFIDNKPNDWVNIVVNGVHNTPFANVRMIFADITEDEARAKGYIKGKYKKEEVFKLLKRSVTPTTIYKKQKFDKNDLIDADFDVLPWIKQEMNIKFNEEKARAYLFGDGRSTADEDKIDETHISPVVADEDLFSIKKVVTPEQGESLEHAMINAAMVAHVAYHKILKKKYSYPSKNVVSIKPSLELENW